MGVGRAAQSVASPGVHTFAANLPIQSGDLIGVDISDGAVVAAENANGSTYLRWVPGLLDGSTKASDSDFGGEVLLSADVQYPEPAAPAKKKCKKKKKHRAAEAKKKKCKKSRSRTDRGPGAVKCCFPCKRRFSSKAAIPLPQPGHGFQSDGSWSRNSASLKTSRSISKRSPCVLPTSST